MAGVKNLIRPSLDRTADERRESAKKAGKASGESRLRKKNMRETIEYVMSLPVVNEGIIEDIRSLGFKGEIDNQTALIVAQFKKAIEKGDQKSFELLRDGVGEKPIDKIEVSRPDSEVAKEIRIYLDTLS